MFVKTLSQKRGGHWRATEYPNVTGRTRGLWAMGLVNPISCKHQSVFSKFFPFFIPILFFQEEKPKKWNQKKRNDMTTNDKHPRLERTSALDEQEPMSMWHVLEIHNYMKLWHWIIVFLVREITRQFACVVVKHAFWFLRRVSLLLQKRSFTLFSLIKANLILIDSPGSNAFS